MALRVKDAMKAKIVTVSATANVEEVCELLFRNNATCLPVVDQEGYYLGLLSETDILDWFFNQPRSLRVASDCMRADAPVVFSETRLTGLMDLFSQPNTQHATVIDDGRVVSVITVRELIRYTSKIHKRLDKKLNKSIGVATIKESNSSKAMPTTVQGEQAQKQARATAVHPQHKNFSPHLTEKTRPVRQMRRSAEKS